MNTHAAESFHSLFKFKRNEDHTFINPPCEETTTGLRLSFLTSSKIDKILLNNYSLPSKYNKRKMDQLQIVK